MSALATIFSLVESCTHSHTHMNLTNWVAFNTCHCFWLSGPDALSFLGQFKAHIERILPMCCVRKFMGHAHGEMPKAILSLMHMHLREGCRKLWVEIFNMWLLTHSARFTDVRETNTSVAFVFLCILKADVN